MGFSKAQQESNELQDLYFGLLQAYMKVPLKTFLAQLPQMGEEVLSQLAVLVEAS